MKKNNRSKGIELADIKNCKERKRVVQIKARAGKLHLNDLFISVIIENQNDDVYIHLLPVFIVENLLPIPLTFLVLLLFYFLFIFYFILFFELILFI